MPHPNRSGSCYVSHILSSSLAVGGRAADSEQQDSDVAHPDGGDPGRHLRGDHPRHEEEALQGRAERRARWHGAHAQVIQERW